MIAQVAIVALFGASVFNAGFDRANDMYSKGDFAGAVNQYEQLVRDGVVDASVFFNLGNAYYREGRLGPAIANYERALHLNPHFDAARHNLEVGIQQTERHLQRPLPPEWERSLLFWHYGLSPRMSFWTAVVCWFLFWTILAMRQWRSVAFSRIVAGVVVVLAAAFATSAWAKAYPPLLAVACEKKVPVHYGIGDNETVRFELYEGDRVTVERRSGGWDLIATADGERGWTRESKLALVGPPYERPTEPASPNLQGSS